MQLAPGGETGQPVASASSANVAFADRGQAGAKASHQPVGDFSSRLLEDLDWQRLADPQRCPGGMKGSGQASGSPADPARRLASSAATSL